jgi:hypothetical protein
MGVSFRIDNVIKVEAYGQSPSQIMSAGSDRRYAINDLKTKSRLSNAVEQWFADLLTLHRTSVVYS